MAAPVRGSMDPTPEELEERRVMLAKGEPPAAIAVRFGRSLSAIYNQASREKERIARIREEVLGEIDVRTRDRWITDEVKSREVREALAEDTMQRRADPDLPARDVSRYTRDIDMLIHRSHEAAGMLPQRVQAQVEQVGTATYEIVGLEGVQKAWEESGSPGPSSSRWAPVTPADPVPPPTNLLPPPPEHAGRKQGPASADPEVERLAQSMAETVAQKGVVHRSRLLDRVGGKDGKASEALRYAAQTGWVIINGDQVRPGVPSSPVSPRSASEALLR